MNELRFVKLESDVNADAHRISFRFGDRVLFTIVHNGASRTEVADALCALAELMREAS